MKSAAFTRPDQGAGETFDLRRLTLQYPLGLKVVEVTRPNRQLRYQQGKNDRLDAEGAARSVLSGQAIAAPKTQTGSVEMIRHLKVARDTAVKSRSVTMVTLITLIINAPAELRDILIRSRGKSRWSGTLLHSDPGQLRRQRLQPKLPCVPWRAAYLMLNDEVVEYDRELKAR